MNLFNQNFANFNGFEAPSYPAIHKMGWGLLASVPSFNVFAIVKPVLFSVVEMIELTGDDQ